MLDPKPTARYYKHPIAYSKSGTGWVAISSRVPMRGGAYKSVGEPDGTAPWKPARGRSFIYAVDSDEIVGKTTVCHSKLQVFEEAKWQIKKLREKKSGSV